MTTQQEGPRHNDQVKDRLMCLVLGRRRLVLAVVALLALAGTASWLTMPREEDPHFPERNGLIVVPFPGADAETVERLVLEPIEERLAEVEEVWHLYSTARAGVGIVRVELLETIYETGDAWDEVEDALALARPDFPRGVGEPTLDDDLVEQEAVVLAITGSGDPLRLAAAAERIKRRLLTVPGTRRVKLIADPQEQITIEYDDAMARRLGLDPRTLGLQLAQRSEIVPGGLLHLGAKTANLRPRTDFASVDEIAATPILLPSGSSVPLETLARVRLSPQEPATERMRWRGEPAVGLGVVPRNGIDRLVWGDDLREQLAELAPTVAPLQIEEVVFQPDQVETRLDQLSKSLLLGILIVAAVLFASMGPRLGLLVALVVPLVTFSAIGIFAATGGIIHQISIAALVIALGMLVDNAIVMVEAIQYRLDLGEPRRQAVLESIRELILPLGTATGTTLAAFIPMLLAEGGTGDFTRSIPTLIMMTLSISYFFAVVATPVMAEMVLRPRTKSQPDRAAALLPRRLAGLAVRHPVLVLVATSLLLGATLSLAPLVKKQFFPAADRTTLVLDLEMPEGTHLEETDSVSRQIETDLEQHPQVRSVAAFIGRAAPHFYYNLLDKPSSPHRAQLVIETTTLPAVEELTRWSRELVHREYPQISAVARRLEQGPPVAAPVELRLFGHDLEALERASDAVLAEVRAVPGTRDERHDLSQGSPTVVFEINDAEAARHGITRADVALALLGRTLGTEVGQFRVGEDPVPILVRSSAGETFPAADLQSLDIATPGGQPVPLGQVARLDVEWRPAAIHHRDRQRVVSVLAQVADDVTASGVLRELQPRLDALQLPDGVRLEYGGEGEESGAANAAILRVMPIGALLLLFFLLAEFNSFRRIGIVLITVPLAVVGVIPGLLLSGQPFGFMSLLGILALVGIVVNNAIVLMEVIETRRAGGDSIDLALAEAVQRRTRPILLTMATTVAGLSPLAFSGATLWPPLAWAMISGLISSTLLTLLVVPALYKLLFDSHFDRFSGAVARWNPLRWLRRRPAVGSAAANPSVAGLLLLAALLGPGSALAQAETPEEIPALTLQEAMQRAAARPGALAAEFRQQAASQAAEAESRAFRRPSVSAFASAVWNDDAFALDTPIGSFTLSERDSQVAGIRIRQPLVDIAGQRYATQAAHGEAAAATLDAERLRQRLAAEAAEAFLAVLEIDAARRTTDAFIDSLQARLAETEERVQAGRSLEADALKVRLDLESAQLDGLRLAELRQVAVHDLGRTVGLVGPVQPEYDGVYDRARDPTPATLAAAAQAHRSDMAALETRAAALGLRAQAVHAERLPRLDATASWQTVDGDAFQPDGILRGSLDVTWTPFAAGTRAPRKAALEAQRDALLADLQALRRGIDLEIRQALSRLVVARKSLEVRERGVELATETLRVETERYRAGRATTNDQLDAEAALRDQRTRHELAKLDILRAWVQLQLATGGPL